MQQHSRCSQVRIGDSVVVGNGSPLLLIAGPCQIESREHCLEVADALKGICANYPVQLIFKASFDKANRTSIKGGRGVGMEKGLAILDEVKRSTSLQTVTDIHSVEQAFAAAEVVDLLQIPAFLCRQTDLLLAAAATAKPIHLKKGQFLAPEDMRYAAEKISSAGNDRILLCERGSCFGYRDLVVDMRGLVLMREMGYPLIFDATHSVQRMGGGHGSSGGERRFVAPLLRAALAVGVDGVFIECHQNPEKAPSDGATMLPLSKLPDLLSVVVEFHKLRSSLAPLIGDE